MTDVLLAAILDSIQDENETLCDVIPDQSDPYFHSDSVTSLNGAGLSNISGQQNWTGCHMFAFYLNTLLIGSLCLIGLVGNTLSIVVLQKDRHNEIATFQLQVLAVADNLLLLVSFVVLFVFVGLAEFEDVAKALRPAAPYMKKYINPVGYITKSFAIWITVLLAINRFIAVCKPFQAARLLTKRRAQLQVTLVAIMTFSLNLPRLFQIDIVYKLNSRNETVLTNELTPFGQNRLAEVVYFNAIYTSVVVIAPLLLLVVFNTLLVRRLRVSQANMKRNSLSYVASQENNITRIMIIIIVEMLICHTPDRVVTVLKYLIDKPHWFCPHPLSYAIVIANILIVLNSSTNFFVYYGFRQRFRRILHKKILPSCCGGSADKYKAELSWSTPSNNELLRNNHCNRTNGARENRIHSCGSEAGLATLAHNGYNIVSNGHERHNSS